MGTASGHRRELVRTCGEGNDVFGTGASTVPRCDYRDENGPAIVSDRGRGEDTTRRQAESSSVGSLPIRKDEPVLGRLSASDEGRGEGREVPRR